MSARVGESEEEESCSESTESNSLDAKLLRSKFASLAATLQETNQNLVTFEYLLENNKTKKPTESPKVEAKTENDEDRRKMEKTQRRTQGWQERQRW